MTLNVEHCEIQSAPRHNDFWFSVKMRVFTEHDAELINCMDENKKGCCVQLGYLSLKCFYMFQDPKTFCVFPNFNSLLNPIFSKQSRSFGPNFIFRSDASSEKENMLSKYCIDDSRVFSSMKESKCILHKCEM